MLDFKTLELRLFGNDEVNSVLAREVYEKLEVKSNFTTWFKREADDLGFVENQDYIMLITDSKSGKRDFILTSDTAKALGLASRTEIGKEVRQYFINVEKIARDILGEKKLNLEMKKLETEETLLKEEIIDKRVMRVKLLQSMGVNFDPTSMIDTGKIKSQLPQDVGQAMTDAVSDIRPAVNGYSTTAMLKEFRILMKAKDFNLILIEMGVINTTEDGFKELSDEYRWYGYNKHSSSVKKYPVLISFYKDRFTDLVTLVRNEGYLE